MKRGRGRPRIHPKPDPNAPKRPRGRPPGSKNRPPGMGPLPPTQTTPAAAPLLPVTSVSAPAYWSLWGLETFEAERTILAVSAIPGPDVPASLRLYFEVWNLCRWAAGRGESAALEGVVADRLPRSFLWLQSTLRWVELLLAAPDWCLARLAAFFRLSKEERLRAFTASQPSANPNVAFNVLLQKHLEAELASLPSEALAVWLSMSEASKQPGRGPLLPWGKSWLPPLLRAQGAGGILKEASGLGLGVEWPSQAQVEGHLETIRGSIAEAAAASVAAGDYPGPDSADELIRHGGKVAGLDDAFIPAPPKVARTNGAAAAAAPPPSLEADVIPTEPSNFSLGSEKILRMAAEAGLGCSQGADGTIVMEASNGRRLLLAEKETELLLGVCQGSAWIQRWRWAKSGQSQAFLAIKSILADYLH